MGTGNLVNVLIPQCSTGAGYMIWWSVQIAYLAVLLMMGLWFSVKWRHLPLKFNESTVLTMSICVLTLAGVILVAVDFIANDSPNVTAYTRVTRFFFYIVTFVFYDLGHWSNVCECHACIDSVRTKDLLPQPWYDI